MAAHASADTGRRTLAILLRLPGPLFRAVLGQEWNVEHGRALTDDIFSTIRDKPCPPHPHP